MNRAGFSLVEVVVSLALVAVGVSLCVRLLVGTERSLDEAELGLRAALFLSEVATTPLAEGGMSEPRTAGPGRLVPGTSPEAVEVRYEPPSRGGDATSAFHRERTWTLTLTP